ncbi:hypothetical protein Tco_0941065 [Tanacetum coccineum]|uniref:Uncharacterized protein n=1 Tax=Tanacetum coccineum TaxID=301880 RepID=A0ABQ5DQE1_9ASTR
MYHLFELPEILFNFLRLLSLTMELPTIIPMASLALARYEDPHLRRVKHARVSHVSLSRSQAGGGDVGRWNIDVMGVEGVGNGWIVMMETSGSGSGIVRVSVVVEWMVSVLIGFSSGWLEWTCCSVSGGLYSVGGEASDGVEWEVRICVIECVRSDEKSVLCTGWLSSDVIGYVRGWTGLVFRELSCVGIRYEDYWFSYIVDKERDGT